MGRRRLFLIPLLLATLPAVARAGTPVVLAPTTPLGVASEFPKSPLADAFVFGDARFANPREAHAHRCPTDAVAWVEAGSDRYQLVTPRFKQPAVIGYYLCQADALSEGDQPNSLPTRRVNPSEMRLKPRRDRISRERTRHDP